MNEEFFSNELDPELEARIVAMVLGEVSDFERDQLEQLIEVRPELLQVRKQLEEMHGLLSEVGGGEFMEQDDEPWELSGDRRQHVLSVIDGAEENPITASVVVERIVSRSWLNWAYSHRIAVIATSACVVVGAGLFTIPSVEMARDSARNTLALAEIAQPPASAGFENGDRDTPTEAFAGAIAGLAIDGRERSEGAEFSALSKSSPRLSLSLPDETVAYRGRRSGDALSVLRGTLGTESSSSGNEPASPSSYYRYEDREYFPAAGQPSETAAGSVATNETLGFGLEGMRRSLTLPILGEEQSSAGPGVSDIAGTSLANGAAGADYGGGYGGFGGGGRAGRAYGLNGGGDASGWYGSSGPTSAGENVQRWLSRDRPSVAPEDAGNWGLPAQPLPEPMTAMTGGLQAPNPSSPDNGLQVPDGEAFLFGGIKSERAAAAFSPSPASPPMTGPSLGDIALLEDFESPQGFERDWENRFRDESSTESAVDESDSSEGMELAGQAASPSSQPSREQDGLKYHDSFGRSGLESLGGENGDRNVFFETPLQSGSEVQGLGLQAGQQGQSAGLVAESLKQAETNRPNAQAEQSSSSWERQAFSRQAGQPARRGSTAAVAGDGASGVQNQSGVRFDSGLSDPDFFLGTLRGGMSEKQEQLADKSLDESISSLDSKKVAAGRGLIEDAPATGAVNRLFLLETEERVLSVDANGTMQQAELELRELKTQPQDAAVLYPSAEVWQDLSGRRKGGQQESEPEPQEANQDAIAQNFSLGAAPILGKALEKTEEGGKLAYDSKRLSRSAVKPQRQRERQRDRAWDSDDDVSVVSSSNGLDVGQPGSELDGWSVQAKDSLQRLSVMNGLVDIDSDGNGAIDGVLMYQIPQVQFGDDLATAGQALASKSKAKKAPVVPEEESAEEAFAEFDYLADEGKKDGVNARTSSSLQSNLAEESVSKTGFKRSLFRQEKSSIPKGMEEKSAAEEAFSTFSLHVSDVSFKLAYSALAQGSWPEADKVRIEEFVNAMDYRDPLPNWDEKVACRVEQSIHPFLQQRNLMRVSMRTSATGRAASTPLRLTLLLDNSGSMERPDRRQTVRRAFELLTQQLQAGDQITLISFANTPRLLADQVEAGRSAELVELIQSLPSEGGTNIEAALQLAFEKAMEQKVDGAQNRIVLLTDGAVNLGDANPGGLSEMVMTMRDAGVAFDAAGISAQDLNDEVLEALTRKGDGRYYLLDSLDQADDGFAKQIAGALRPSAKNVKVQVEFNPDRVGNYKLLGFEKHLLKKEDFRNDAVDAAEMAAAEAGVAVYQFEAKPDGEGDVGSVSVRFKDMATGEMVEQRWPIPYEPTALRTDVSAPSLRVATASAMLAAKLKGDPLGASVDLAALASLVAGLPESERDNERVQMLQTMIELARDMMP